MKKTLFLLACALLLTGCGILSTQPYIQTYYFDIGSPASHTIETDFNLEIMSFNTDGPYQDRMVFRNAPNQVEFDEFNRWSMTPATMIKRYMLLTYDCGDDTNPNILKKYAIKGEIVQIEADLQHKMINLALRLSMSETESGNFIWTRTFKQQIPVQNITGTSFAGAVKTGMDNIIKELNIYIKSLKKNVYRKQ